MIASEGRQAAAARCSSRTSAGVRQSERLARAAVERVGDGGQVVGAVAREVGALGEVLPEQPVGVLVGAALPGALRVAEVHLQAEVDLQPGVLGQLGALVPGQRAAQVLGQRAELGGDRVADGLGARPGDGRPVLDARAVAAGQRRQVQQHGEAAGALDQGADRRAVDADDQVALPVARDGAIGGLGGPLADHHLLADEALAALADAGPGDAQRPAGAQARGQLAGQRAAALHEQRLVDRLVRDPHRRIIGEVDAQPGRDLLRAPRRRPPAVLTARLVATLPRPDRRTRHRGPVGPPDLAGEAVLHVLAQSVVGGELGRLGTTRHQLGLPLRHRRPVLQLAAARGRVAPQLARDRRRRPADLTRDLAHALAFGAQQRDLLALCEAQVPARDRVAAGTSPSRHAHETTGRQPLTRPRPRAPRPRCSGPWRSPARTTARPRADATACPATSSPNAPSTPSSNQPACPSQLLSSRCCDDRVNPPWLPWSE